LNDLSHKNELNNKLIVIVGPTASGKTAFSLALAKKFGGQIISADSRQVYRGLDIGSGKITKHQMAGIPHYLLDVVSPKKTFTVAHYQKLATAAIKKIQQKDAIAFLVGGTGFYVQSIVDGITIPEVPPNKLLRKQLAKKSTGQLFALLQKLDPDRAKTIDAKNPRRLIRAIEIAKVTKKPITLLKANPQFKVLQIGIKKSPKELQKLISIRLHQRLPGIIREVKRLHANGLSWKRLESFGLEYRFGAHYLQKKITKQGMVEGLQKAIEHFAKRQLTWFKKDQRIHWIKTQHQAEVLIENFLKK